MTCRHSAVLLDLPYLYSDTDRHGNTRLFVRRYGRKVRLRDEPGTQSFAKAYSEALDVLAEYKRHPAADERKPAAGRTVGMLGAAMAPVGQNRETA